MRRIFFAVIFVTLIGIEEVLGEVVQIECSADTMIHELFDAANFGGHTQVASGSTQHVLDGHVTRTRALVRFSLEGKIPPGAALAGASLKVKVLPVPREPSAAADYELHRMLASWGEGTGTSNGGRAAAGGEAAWKWRANPLEWGEPGGQAGSDYALSSSARTNVAEVGEFTFSDPQLVEDVKRWLATPAENLGWMLLCSSEEAGLTARRFGSREGGSPVVLTLEFASSGVELRFSSIERQGTNAVVSWTGGSAPYQLQSRDIFGGGIWTNAALPETSASRQIPMTNRQRFFRVVSGL